MPSRAAISGGIRYGLASLVLTILLYAVGWVATMQNSDTGLKVAITTAGVLPSFALLARFRKKLHEKLEYIASVHVGPLSLLYVGIATGGFVTSLTTAFREESPFAVSQTKFLMFLAFLTISIPFYHGALTYLQRKTSEVTKRTVDFLFLLIEASVILLMSASVSAASVFVTWMGLLLAIDVIWLLIALSDKRVDPPPATWLWINLGTLLFIIISWFGFGIALDSIEFLSGLLVVSVARSITDYAGGWNVYFPTPTDEPTSL